MAATALVDAGFLIALLDRRDGHHQWATEIAARHPPPWTTCEAVLSEAFYILGQPDGTTMAALLQRGAVTTAFRFEDATAAVLALMKKYATVPMSFADACLVRMTELLPEPILLTTDADFQVYRRNGRQAVPCAMPG